jgi:hypothetical protein
MGTTPPPPPKAAGAALAPLASSFACGRAASGDGSGPSAALRLPHRPSEGLDATASAAMAASDERSLRLSKSLSERSLQHRLAAINPYRRVPRVLSRFSLLKQVVWAPGSGVQGRGGLATRVRTLMECGSAPPAPSVTHSSTVDARAP